MYRTNTIMMGKMKKINTILAILLCNNLMAKDDATDNKNKDIEKLDNVEVIEYIDNQSIVKILPEQAQSAIDTADVLKKIAGANVNRNGPLSGIAQYRGLFGERVNVKIDGIKIQESGPNSMDAVMSHMPVSMVDAVILHRGIAPISSSIESIGGHIEVIAKQPENNDEEFKFATDLSLGFSSADSGKKSSLFVSGSSKKHQAYIGIDYENGDSFDFDGGTNFNTEYDKKFYQVGYNLTLDDQKLSLKANFNDTGKTGTPSLPMDIKYIRGGMASGEYSVKLNNNTSLVAKLGYQNSNHVMNNFQFRNTANKLESLNELVSRSYGLHLLFNRPFGDITIGFDGDDTSHQSDIFNPDNPTFLINNFNTTKERNSIFAELSKNITNTFQLTTGVRFTLVDTDAKDVSTTVAMMTTPMGNLHRTLRDRFNAADRNIQDSNFDFSFNLNQELTDSLNLEYGIAYKTRSPSYIERYLWLPLEATAGLADGLRHFGNINLDPEHAVQFEFGINYHNEKVTFSPHIFYHQINDYIQGTPTTSIPAPPGTLTFNNVDAKIYGLDYEFNYQISDKLVLNNITSYVRGKRRDISDNLYRIAPFNTSLELVYSNNNWKFSSEIIAYDSQDDVSITNSERSSSGYAFANLAGNYMFNKTANIAFGVNNIFDRKYADHLGGFNRNNLNTDVGFNSNDIRANKLPSIGINIYATLYLHW